MILAYLITSIMVFLVMRMLGEMAVLEPDTGSFSTYARKAIGPWAGFTIGWLYWWFWVLAIPVEAIAGAEILHSWFPSVSVSIYAFCFIVFLSLANFLVPKVLVSLSSGFLWSKSLPLLVSLLLVFWQFQVFGL